MLAVLPVMSVPHVNVPFVTWARRTTPAPVVLFAKLKVRPDPFGVIGVLVVPPAVWPRLKPIPAYEYIVPLTAAMLPVSFNMAVVNAAIGAGMTIDPKASA